MYNYNYSINEQFTMIIGYRNGRLTWHNGIIPATEIWVKIGGDKGGGSFKFNFQIVSLQIQFKTHVSSHVLKLVTVT